MHLFSSIYTYRYIFRRLPKDILNSTYCQSNVLPRIARPPQCIIFDNNFWANIRVIAHSSSIPNICCISYIDKRKHMQKSCYRSGDSVKSSPDRKCYIKRGFDKAYLYHTGDIHYTYEIKQSTYVHR